MSPEYFARKFRELGVDLVFGSVFPADAAAPVDDALILGPHEKLKVAREVCAERDLDFDSTVAFGDSSSDRPLFEVITHSVSVNGDTGTEACARYQYRGDDLWRAYAMVPHAEATGASR
jgi:phosphoserine phosphatase